jgi:hypothetical protein
MDLMTQAAYARHRGVSRQAIHKAVDAGKIKLREQGGGRKGIDPAEADRALGLNVQRVLAGAEDESASAEASAGQARAPSHGLTQARTATEVYRARIAQLEYEERVAKLRPIEQTEIGAQRCGEVILRAVDGLVGRAEELNARAIKEGTAGVRSGLRAIVRDLRTVIARELARLASGDTASPEEGFAGASPEEQAAP